MFRLSFRKIELPKLFPLTISRGTTTTSTNLFVFAEEDGHVGIGELSPATASAWTADSGERQLRRLAEELSGAESITTVYQMMRERKIDPPAMAALDIALWDLFAKKCGQPLYRIFGLPKPTAQTSVTIGIEPKDVILERVPKILEITSGKCLKIKLGSPAGIDQDKENFLAAKQASAPYGVRLRVDANGGWTVGDAKHMISWLAAEGVDYVEQPLVEGAEDQLPELFEGRPIPIFVDETCRFVTDVARVYDRVDGVNLKLMKCGGLTEALRIVGAARAHRLKTMIGCMSESSIAIAAGCSIGACFDYIDLDSHMNMAPDVAEGLSMVDGVVLPSDSPGHGARLKPEFA